MISTLNIQHLESVNDVVERITGVKQRETIPDAVVRRADQVELVDMTPEALRRRMAHGNVYKSEQDRRRARELLPARQPRRAAGARAALGRGPVDEGLESYRERHGITEPWETRERVLVAITGAPGTEALIRRAARMAQRSHGELLGVHVRNDDGLAGGGRSDARRAAPPAARPTSAASTTRSSRPTSRPRSPSWPASRTARSSCSVRAGGRAGPS